jgi:hypothetical protein
LRQNETKIQIKTKFPKRNFLSEKLYIKKAIAFDDGFSLI